MEPVMTDVAGAHLARDTSNSNDSIYYDFFLILLSHN